MRRSFLGTMFCFPLIVVLSMWLAALNADSRSWMRPDAVVFGTAAIVSLLSLYCALNLAFLRRLARALSRCSNTGAAGMLLRMHNHALKTRAWREINLELESTISECLTRLLSRFEKSDYRLLDRHERALLLNLIVGDRREPAHAAVEAVARLGDPEDIAFLARIADSPLAGRKRWTVFPGMRERAMQGILKIDERRRKEEAGGNLLRPCEPPAEETLLRTPTSAEVDSSCLLHSL